MIPVVQRGAAEPGRRWSDFLERRHDVLLPFSSLRAKRSNLSRIA
jgi:hypothetical protein